jgi:hypothetical protein
MKKPMMAVIKKFPINNEQDWIALFPGTRKKWKTFRFKQIKITNKTFPRTKMSFEKTENKKSEYFIISNCCSLPRQKGKGNNERQARRWFQNPLFQLQFCLTQFTTVFGPKSFPLVVCPRDTFHFNCREKM